MKTSNLITGTDEEGSKQKKDSDLGSNDSDVSEPARLRCPILHGIESDKEFLCNYHRYFLPTVTLIIWGVLLLT